MLYCTMTKLFNYLIFILSFLSGIALVAAEIRTDLNLNGRSFVGLENDQTMSIDFFLLSNKKIKNYNKFEFNTSIYFENSGNLDKYIDLGRSAYRFKSGPLMYSIGRFDPTQEMLDNYEPNILNAIGKNWAKNEQNPFNVRPVGWVGSSVNYLVTKKINFYFHYSPIFIPTMGPKIIYSKSAVPTTNSYFTRMPPGEVKFNEQSYLPIRVTLDDVNLKEILFQHQLYFGMNYQLKTTLNMYMSVWSAPAPNPLIKTSESINIIDEDIYILANADPVFPRENNIALGLNYERSKSQILYNSYKDSFTISSSYKHSFSFKIGFLHTFYQGQTADLEKSNMDQFLGWIKLRQKIGKTFLLKSDIFKNLDSRNNGMSLNVFIDYLKFKSTVLYVGAQAFTGGDNSYYGQWRALDFISLGLKTKW